MRLFIAVDFNDEILDMLRNSQRQLQAQVRSASLTAEENLHLTLAFLGETEEPGRAIQAMKNIILPSFPLRVGGKAGHFGDLWWIGTEESRSLARLADTLKKHLREEGFFIEEKKFRPHITIARRVVPIQDQREIRLHAPKKEMTVSGFSLMKSERSGGRLRYTELYWKSLSEGKNAENDEKK